MSQRLPIFINPDHFCTRRLMVSGSLELENMQRLRDRLVAPYGAVDVKLEFTKDGRRNLVSGQVNGVMMAECQRCLKAVEIPVNHEFTLAFVESDAEMESLLPGEEPCMVGEEELRLADLIEDELELYLPMIVMHTGEQCLSEDALTSEDARDEIEERQNPFAVLAQLKD